MKTNSFSVRSIALVALAASFATFAVGCAAPDEEEEDVGVVEDGVVYFPNVKISPDAFMDRAAERARNQCRFTRDANGALSGPYGLVTIDVRVGDGVVGNVSVQAPHAGTAIGRCITRAISELKPPADAAFERTKRFTIKAPGGA